MLFKDAGNRTLAIPESILSNLNPPANPKGKPVITLSPSTVTNSFVRLVKKAGLPHFRFHDLRHYYASTLLAINVHDKYAMQRMGQSTNQVLKNVYQHTFAERDEEITTLIHSHINSIIQS